MQQYRDEYGPIVRLSLSGDEVVVFDPREFLKGSVYSFFSYIAIVYIATTRTSSLFYMFQWWYDDGNVIVYRAEGPYPRNFTQEFWPFVQYYRKRSAKTPGLAKVGKEWKDMRRKLQPDILSPQTAASYLPALAPVAEDMSTAFPDLCGDMERFCTSAVFDMFSAAILGQSYKTLITTETDTEGYEFAKNSQEAFRLCGDLMADPAEKVYSRWNYDSPKRNAFEERMDAAYAIAERLTRESLRGVTVDAAVAENGTTTGCEEDDTVKIFDGEVTTAHDTTPSSATTPPVDASYIQRLIRRGRLTVEEAVNEVPPLVFAGVDTTATLLHWFLVHLAQHPREQELLAEELASVLQGSNYTPEVALPYLRMCYRESHRLTPALTSIGSRRLDADITLFGYNIPAHTKIHFNIEALQNDGTLVANTSMFIPERWSSTNVQARKGTPFEVLDHRLIATAFSFGPRMCIGGRLAEMEVLTAVCRLVQDYAFVLADNHPSIGKKERLFLIPNQSPKFCVRVRKERHVESSWRTLPYQWT